MRWQHRKDGTYVFYHGATYAVISQTSKKHWNLLISAQVNGKTVRYGGGHTTMAEAIAKAHTLTQ